MFKRAINNYIKLFQTGFKAEDFPLFVFWDDKAHNAGGKILDRTPL